MCNTEQNYSGEQVFQNTSEPTAQPQPPTGQNQAQPLSPTDERRAYFRQLADHPASTDYLQAILDRIADFADATDPVPTLAELTSFYLSSPFLSPQQGAPRKASQVLDLIGFLSDLRTYYECFALNAEVAQQANAGEGQYHD